MVHWLKSAVSKNFTVAQGTEEKRNGNLYQMQLNSVLTEAHRNEELSMLLEIEPD